MNKKGFTLIELLSVIIILAIIASIAISIVLSVIETSRMGAFKDSSYSVFDAVEYYMLKNNLSQIPEEGVSVLDLDLKNNPFESGTVILNNNSLEVKNLSDGRYCANGVLEKLVIVKGSCDVSAPIITLSSISLTFVKGTDYDLASGFTYEDLETGIKSTSILLDGVPISNILSLDYGEYTIVYKVINNINLIAIEERTIKIINLSDYEYDFVYKGSAYEFEAPYSGYYKLQTWGAAGGSGAYGAYASGVKYLQAGEKLYVYVGNIGKSIAGSAFNGGGACYGYGSFPFYGGGGATDIRTTSNTSYSDRIIVAGGGAGGGYQMTGSTSYGYGGGGPVYGYAGISVTYPATTAVGGKCSVTTGACWTSSCTSLSYTAGCTAGGGGGYVGGIGIKSGTTGPTGNWPNYSMCMAQGGTSYTGGIISYKEETIKSIFGNAQMPTFDETSTMTGNPEAGHAKITLIEINQ